MAETTEGKKLRANATGTELVWEGKRTQVERIPLPFQVIETINQSRATREQAPLLAGLPPPPLFESATGTKDVWRNKLIWGDNKYVLASLLKEGFAGKLNLIYIDPPFDTGDDFSFRVKVGDEELVKQPSIIEQKAYNDTWGKGTDSYLQMMYERLVLMRELLAENGSIYVHLDWHVGHYIKLSMDEIFGKANFLNEVIWSYRRWPASSKNFQTMHENILFYAKDAQNDDRVFNVLYEPLAESTLKADGGLKIKNIFDERGRRIRGEKTGEVSPGTPQRDVFDISFISATGSERTGFATQKPEALLERIIKASSNEGALVADFFCGSGTTLAVAEKLGRRWLGCDLGRFAIHTTRKRLLDIPDCQPFEILNLGKYERKYWQMNGIKGRQKDSEKAIFEYLAFIVKLYHAEPVIGFSHLHGRKAGRMVHVGATDAPVTLSEIIEL
jgi:DNA modification methylase